MWVRCRCTLLLWESNKLSDHLVRSSIVDRHAGSESVDRNARAKIAWSWSGLMQYLDLDLCDFLKATGEVESERNGSWLTEKKLWSPERKLRDTDGGWCDPIKCRAMLVKEMKRIKSSWSSCLREVEERGNKKVE
jgi:hypothetical protein